MFRSWNDGLSLLRLEVGDDVSAVLRVGNTGEGHRVARSVIGGRLDVLVDGLSIPLRLAGKSTTKES